MKLHLDRLRASLFIPTIDKLCLIHVCRRVLDRDQIKGFKRNIHELTEEEQVQMEDIFIKMDRPEITTGLGPTEESFTQSTRVPQGPQGVESFQARKRPRLDASVEPLIVERF
jgi:hypothetical protein